MALTTHEDIAEEMAGEGSSAKTNKQDVSFVAESRSASFLSTDQY
jgi:hypothetical protein